MMMRRATETSRCSVGPVGARVAAPLPAYAGRARCRSCRRRHPFRGLIRARLPGPTSSPWRADPAEDEDAVVGKCLAVRHARMPLIDEGGMFAGIHTQAQWGGWRDHVWYYVQLFLLHPREALLGDPRHLIIIGNVLLGLICLALVPTMLRKLDPTTAMISSLLVVGQFLITWVSLGRYLMPAVGIYISRPFCSEVQVGSSIAN